MDARDPYDADVGDFVDVTLSRVPRGFEFPEPLRRLFEWVEQQGFVATSHDGDRYGTLSGEHRIGTAVELRGYTTAETASYVRAWFGDVTGDPAARLWPFIRTGGEGSMGVLWLGDDHRTRIVHLGSGSGSLLTCVLADNGTDFLRLLAIGYAEICWSQDFAAPPPDGDPVNEPYREWVRRTFNTDIPATALQIVREPAQLGGPTTSDPFCRWVTALLAKD
jgi:hypothetical protein